MAPLVCPPFFIGNKSDQLLPDLATVHDAHYPHGSHGKFGFASLIWSSRQPAVHQGRVHNHDRSES